MTGFTRKCLTAVLLVSMVFCAGIFAQGGSEEAVVEEAAPIKVNVDGFPIVEEPMTFRIKSIKWPNHAEFKDMQIFKDLEEKTNVHIEWLPVPSASLNEQKNLIFANRNNLPDAVWGQMFRNDDVLNYAKQGLVIPLDDLIDQYAPNIKRVLANNAELRRAMVAPDGHIYSIAGYEYNPHLRIQNKIWINEDWLKELGMEKPTTVDELYEVLAAMKGKDLNHNGLDDEIPFTIETENLVKWLAPWGVPGEVVVNDGKVSSGYLEPGFREGMAWYNKLYKEGLLDRELFTQTLAQLVAKGSGPDMKLGAFFRLADYQIVSGNQDSYGPVEALEGPAGKYISADGSMIVTCKFEITSACEHPEVLIRWVDNMYTTEGAMTVSRGPENVGWKYNDDGSISLLDAPDGTAYGVFRNGHCPGGTAPAAYFAESRVNLQPSDEALREICEEYYFDYMPEETFPRGIFYTTEESVTRAKLYTTVQNFTMEHMARFITGELDINGKDYDDFVKNLKKLGIDELVAIDQAAYDRYISQ